MKKHIYTFSWIDENRCTVGWNDVQAISMREARKLAKKMETKAHWAVYDRDKRKYVTVPNKVDDTSCFRNTGMYIDPTSFRRTSVERHFENHRIADMMCR